MSKNLKYFDVDPGYKRVDVNLDPLPKKGITMKDRLWHILEIGIPTLVAILSGGLLAWAAYAVKTNVWQHWTTVSYTSTNVHFVSTGQYVHGVSTDIGFDILFGLIWLTIVVLCALWAEAWYD